MKKLSVLSTALLALLLLTACGSGGDKSNSNDNSKDEYKSNSNGNSKDEYKTYQEACNAQDFEAAWSFVYELENKSMELDEYERYIQQKVNAYTSARDFVFNAEVQLLLSNGSKEASDRVLYLLNSLPMKGNRLEEGYEGTDARTSIVDGSSFNKDFAWYCESVNSYNKKCRQIMELCVSQNNKYLADKIVKLVKETPSSNKGHGFDYVVHYSNNDINEVKKMYDDAIASGALTE